MYGSSQDVKVKNVKAKVLTFCPDLKKQLGNSRFSAKGVKAASDHKKAVTRALGMRTRVGNSPAIPSGVGLCFDAVFEKSDPVESGLTNKHGLQDYTTRR